MDPTTQRLMMGAAGAGSEKLYVEDVFSTWLYTGNGSTQTITNGIDLSGKGGLVWIKGRSGATGHRFTDTARGATKSLASDSTAAEATESTGLTSFSSTGFSIGADTDYSTNAATYASWTFRKQAKFFDVVTYVGDNTENRQISHSLGSVPGAVIVKSLNTGNWSFWHRTFSSTDINVFLNTTSAAASQSVFSYNGAASFSSTTFPVSYAGAGGVNTSGQTYVAYLFAHDAGGFGDSGNESVVSCGSYTTNGSGVATITLGWEPQWLLVKRTDSIGSWFMVDTMRKWTAPPADNNYLQAESSAAETQGASVPGSVTSTGFSAFGVASASYIYIAIRRGPMKTPTDATKVFSSLAITTSVTTTGTVRTTGFAVDMMLSTTRTITLDKYISTKLLGGFPSSNISCPNLRTSSIAAESSNPSMAYDAWNTTIKDGSFYGVDSIRYFFRRAPGFFDAVCYTGTGSARTVSHNLGVAPELMIVKRRESDFWMVYTAALGNTKALNLNNASAPTTLINIWNNTSPTSTVFTVGTATDVNASGGTYVAYLFATLTGISKVGSYTGTGTTQQINCGFTAGARFVLIKRTDSTGDWYVWDTARGIVSGNDPYLLLNSTAAEVTNTDYIDPLNSGFEISSTAPAAINANGGTFIYLAIA